jgi:hypothetical protein
MYHRYKLLDFTGINIVIVFVVVIFTDWRSSEFLEIYMRHQSWCLFNVDVCLFFIGEVLQFE